MLTVFEEAAVPIWFHCLIEYKQNGYMQNIVYVHIENTDMTLHPCSMRYALAAFPREHNLCFWCLESRPCSQALGGELGGLHCNSGVFRKSIQCQF